MGLMAKDIFTPKKYQNVSRESGLIWKRSAKGLIVSRSYGKQYIKHYKRIYLYWILNTYKNAKDKESFSSIHTSTSFAGTKRVAAANR